MIYDGDGRRRVKQVSLGTTRYVWDDQKVLLECGQAHTIHWFNQDAFYFRDPQ